MCAHSISTPISSRAPDKGLRQRDRITAHLLETEPVPLPDARLDRVTARNTIVYVRDPVAAFTEFRRVLKAKRSRARNRGRLGIHSGRAAGRGMESPGSCSQLGLANTRYWS